MSEFDKKKNQLKKCLYKRKEELDKIDRLELQKCLFELLRECIKERKFYFEIGSYEINITPEDLSVCYTNDSTTIEVSNEDVYYESIREPETRFFVIADHEQDEYPVTTSAIKISGLIQNIDGDAEEQYHLELYSDNVDNINKYISIIFSEDNREEFSLTCRDIETPYSIIIRRDIKRTDKRTDVSKFLFSSKVIPVKYDLKHDKFVRISNEQINEDYSRFLPSLSEKKEIVSYIYSSIVEFYSKYI